MKFARSRQVPQTLTVIASGPPPMAHSKCVHGLSDFSALGCMDLSLLRQWIRYMSHMGPGRNDCQCQQMYGEFHNNMSSFDRSHAFKCLIMSPSTHDVDVRCVYEVRQILRIGIHLGPRTI